MGPWPVYKMLQCACTRSHMVMLKSLIEVLSYLCHLCTAEVFLLMTATIWLLLMGILLMIYLFNEWAVNYCANCSTMIVIGLASPRGVACFDRKDIRRRHVVGSMQMLFFHVKQKLSEFK